MRRKTKRKREPEMTRRELARYLAAAENLTEAEKLRFASSLSESEDPRKSKTELHPDWLASTFAEYDDKRKRSTMQTMRRCYLVVYAVGAGILLLLSVARYMLAP